jgi:hypothetical protein
MGNSTTHSVYRKQEIQKRDSAEQGSGWSECQNRDSDRSESKENILERGGWKYEVG